MSRGNGEGTIYYSERLKRWVGQYSANKKRKTIYGKTRKEVSQKLIEAQSKLLNNTYVDKSKITLAQILENYIDYRKNTNKIIDRTYRRNQDTLKQIKKSSYDIANVPIQSITTNDIKQFLQTIINYSDNSISKIYGMANKGFRIAVSEKYITSNPFESELIEKPKSSKTTKKVEALTIEQHKKFISVLDPNKTYDLILLIQLYTGMRIGEVLALTMDNIDIKNKLVHIQRTLTRDSNDKVILGESTKTLTGCRTLTLNNDTLFLFRLALKRFSANIYNLIFFDFNKADFITPTQINCYLKRLNDKYKICPNMHTHMLRHTYATRCIEAGMEAKVLQNNLGHRKITTTYDVYASVFQKFQKKEDDKYFNYINANKLSIQ